MLVSKQASTFTKPKAMKLAGKTKAMQDQKFQTWASEINKDWTAGYEAIANENSLIVNFNSEEVARLDYNNSNGRYTVTGTQKEAVEQLEFMLSR